MTDGSVQHKSSMYVWVFVVVGVEASITTAKKPQNFGENDCFTVVIF